MKKLRFLLALWASKTCLRLLRMLKRNATCTPGKIALLVVLAVAGRYMQALGLIAVLPVWLMQNPWSAMVLSLLVAVGCLWIMMRQVSVSVKKERSNSHEAA